MVIVVSTDEVKYDLHVLLVQHGKVCSSCSKSRRGSHVCPLKELKRKGQARQGNDGSKAENKKRKSWAEDSKEDCKEMVEARKREGQLHD